MKRSWRRSMFGDRIPDVNSQTRRLIYIRDGERCGYCHTTAGPFHIDHIMPVRLGGSSDPRNLTPACVDCNKRKGGELSEFWCRLLVQSGAPVPAQRARDLLGVYFRYAV